MEQSLNLCWVTLKVCCVPARIPHVEHELVVGRRTNQLLRFSAAVGEAPDVPFGVELRQHGTIPVGDVLNDSNGTVNITHNVCLAPLRLPSRNIREILNR